MKAQSDVLAKRGDIRANGPITPQPHNTVHWNGWKYVDLHGVRDTTNTDGDGLAITNAVPVAHHLVTQILSAPPPGGGKG